MGDEHMRDEHAQDEHSIAIVGLAGRFPGAADLAAFWRNLRDGVDGVTHFTDDELAALGVDRRFLAAPNFVKAAPVIDGYDRFDAAFFGYSPREAALLDPQQRLFLELSWHALENAGYDPTATPGAVGVFAGMSMSSYLLFNLVPNRSLDPVRDSFQLMIGSDKDFLATRVAYHLNLHGPSLDVQTGCSTSLVAVHLAAESLLSFQCDAALAGGVSIQVPQRWGYFHEEGGINSPDGRCRAFDADGGGTLFGSGAGLVVLKRLADAIEDGDTIHAVIRGSAVNNDGSEKIGFTAPGVDGQAEVIHRAQAIAGVDPESVSYVEAHGTATRLGDPVEVSALVKAFDTDRKGYCGLGAVKSNIGHLDAAAGVAGLLKAVLALENEELPPSLHYETPNPEIDFADSPFYVVAERTPWPRDGEPRRAGVSSFGIGGTNAHAVVEEAPAAEPSDPGRPYQVVVLSARTESALEQVTEDLAAHLAELPAPVEKGDDERSARADDVAFTLQTGRKPQPFRRAVVASGLEDAAKALAENDPERVHTAWDEAESRDVAFLFAGGGAQYAGMGRDLYERETVFRDEIDRGAELLRRHLGYDIRDLLYPAPEREEEASKRMLATSVALPALFLVEVALARQWMDWGVEPAAMMGHSLGEYAAGCLAGVFDLEDALTLVVARGRLFERAPEGGMVSLPLPEAEVRRLMAEVNEGREESGHLDMAAVNGPAQCVVSGPVDAVDAFVERLDAADIEHRRVQIDVAAHSRTVAPILEDFERVVRRIRLSPPERPFVSNVTGTWITAEEATDPAYWVSQLRHTVRFGDGLEVLRRDLSPVLLEVGPGRTLATLAQLSAEPEERRRILASMRHPYDEVDDQEFLLGAVARLWLSRARLDWRAFHGDAYRRRVPLPTYPFESKRYWVDPPAPGDDRRGEDGKNPDVDRWFYRPTAEPLTPVRPWRSGDLTALSGQPLVVLHSDQDGDALTDAVLERLREDGVAVLEARPGDFDATDAASWKGLLDAWVPAPDGETENDEADRDTPPLQVLHLAARGPLSGTPEERFAAAQETGFHGLLAVASALGASGRSATLWAVTDRLVQVLPGEEREPARATLLGPATVLRQEHETVRARVLDIGTDGSAEAASGLASAVLAEVRDELAAPHCGPRWVALRGDQRWGEGYLPLDLEPEGAVRRSLRDGGVYLLTGGLGPVGRHLAEHLARTASARLALLTRRPVPPRERWSATPGFEALAETAAEIEAAGGRVLVLTADVTDPAALRSAVEATVERFGDLDGVFHLAGYSGEETVKLLADIDRREADRHFAAKVHGTRNLEEALRQTGQTPELCLLFSSNVTVLGGLGAAAYSASNLFLDAWAEDRATAGDGPAWIAATWDGWLTGDDTTVASVGTSLDRYAMRPEESLKALGRVVERAPAGRVVVSTGDLTPRREVWLGGRSQDGPSWGEAVEAQPRPDLGTPFTPPGNELEEAVAGVWGEVLGLERLGIDDNFFDLGGNSLLGLKVVNGLQRALPPGTEVTVVQLFEAPTVRAFAKLLEEGSAAEEVVAESASRGERRRARRARRSRNTEDAAELVGETR